MESFLVFFCLLFCSLLFGTSVSLAAAGSHDADDTRDVGKWKVYCTLWTALETNLARQKDTEEGSGTEGKLSLFRRNLGQAVPKTSREVEMTLMLFDDDDGEPSE